MKSKFIPDTPKEYAQIGMAVSRLGTAMSAVLLFQENHIWVGCSLFLTWGGMEVAQYFKMEDVEKEEPKSS